MSPTLTQNEIAKQLGYSSATVKRYRNDVNMPSPYRIHTNTNKKRQKFSNDISNNEHESKSTQMNPKDLKKYSLYLKQIKIQ